MEKYIFNFDFSKVHFFSLLSKKEAKRVGERKTLIFNSQHTLSREFGIKTAFNLPNYLYIELLLFCKLASACLHSISTIDNEI